MTAGERGEEGRTSVALDLADWPGIDVSLELSLLSAGAAEDRSPVGTWVFEGVTPGPATVEIDWLSDGQEALELTLGGGRAEPVLKSARRGDSAVVRPEMVLRLSCGPMAEELPLRVTCTEALGEYYKGEGHQDEYVVQHPFFLAFHKARLHELGKVFEESIPSRGRVLDVGSGYSIFFLLGREWDQQITCCDLDSAAMEKMRSLCPSFTWLVSDAVDLPFPDESFDAVYAGEIVEHVADPMAALAEWNRVLAPGGTLILTTPNRERLLARANRAEMPVHPEHVRELSLPQARAMLKASGFAVQSVRGIYLELGLNWYRPPGKRVDMVISLFGKPEDERLYTPLMRAGRLWPAAAFDLILTCKKT
jgi:SAM-dependent methyltransferase